MESTNINLATNTAWDFENSSTTDISPTDQTHLRGWSPTFIPWRGIPKMRITDGTRRKKKPVAVPMLPCLTTNLADDVHYCAEWAEVNCPMNLDQNRKPVGLLTPASVHACVNTAVVTLVSSGSNIRSLWTIEDLLAVDNFQRIADNCSDFDTLSALVSIARDWLKVSSETMTQLEEVFGSKILF